MECMKKLDVKKAQKNYEKRMKSKGVHGPLVFAQSIQVSIHTYYNNHIDNPKRMGGFKSFRPDQELRLGRDK